MNKRKKVLPLVFPDKKVVKKAETLNRDADIRDAAKKYVKAFEMLAALGVSVSDWDIRDGSFSVEIVNNETGDKHWEIYKF